ncbi:MAG TPA: hypothetical protein VHZ28_15225 [Terracidiphilus sp.]|nr:hypothetical protein [Terracidiphilus sp.]
MKTILFSLCAFAAAGLLHAQDLAATWQGTLPKGSEQHRVAIQFAKKSDGAWSAPLSEVEFLHDGARVDSLDVQGTAIKLTINGGAIVYDGQLNADSSAIAGSWTSDGHSVPLELHRATAQTLWPVPFLYQYHHRDVTYLRPSVAEARIPFTPRLAFNYVEQGAEAWTNEWKCVACHTNGSYMVVRPLLTPQYGAPQKALRDFFVATLQEKLAADPSELKPEQDSTQEVYLAAGLAIWDAHVTHRLSPETAQALDLMFALQRVDGDWTISDDNNPPLESSRFQLATVAARAIANAPGWLARRHSVAVEKKINLLEDYLRSDRKMQDDYDRTDLLWAATELPGLLDSHRKSRLIEMILSRQKADGGWSIRDFARPENWGKGNRAEKLRAELEFSNPPSDGHMTGLAIIVLRKAGITATDPRIRRGVSWLLTNQRSSGRWWTRSLNRDGWQFITYSGTMYPLLALAMCDALPPSV